MGLKLRNLDCSGKLYKRPENIKTNNENQGPKFVPWYHEEMETVNRPKKNRARWFLRYFPILTAISHL